MSGGMPPSPDQRRHNHLTRDIKPYGRCPGCDRTHEVPTDGRDVRNLAERWVARPNEDIGGWCVTTADSASGRVGSDRWVAQFLRKADAHRVAALHNGEPAEPAEVTEHWYVQVDDLLGGWCVMNAPITPADAVTRLGQYEVVDFVSLPAAARIAHLANGGTDDPTWSAPMGSELYGAVRTVDSTGNTVTAAEALVSGPSSPAMFALAESMCDFVSANGGRDVDAVTDYHAASTRPGGLMVRWSSGPTPAAVAAALGPIPCFIELRSDHLDWRYRVPRTAAPANQPPA